MESNTSPNRRNPGIALGRLVKERREAENLSTQQLADELGLSRTYIARLERGKYADPRCSVLMQIAERFKLSQSDFHEVTGFALSDALPDFNIYLHAKHPHWPSACIGALTEYYDFLRHKNNSK